MVTNRKLLTACRAQNREETSFFVNGYLPNEGCPSIKAEEIVDNEELGEINNAIATVISTHFSKKSVL